MYYGLKIKRRYKDKRIEIDYIRLKKVINMDYEDRFSIDGKALRYDDGFSTKIVFYKG